MSAKLEIFTLADLAARLGVELPVAVRLMESTTIPRFTIGGEPRFLAASVLAWLERQEGLELLPIAPAPAPSRPRPQLATALEPAGEGEQPFIASDTLDALGVGAADPGRNLDRLKLRDTLLALNESLLPVLGHLSHGALHPHQDEKSRTSAWRCDDAPRRRINALSIAWGAGDAPPPGFTDRPRLEVELSPGELRVALVTQHGFSTPLDEPLIDTLRDAGIALDEDSAAPAFAKVYPLGHPAPSLAAVVRALEADMRLLVPVWARSR